MTVNWKQLSDDGLARNLSAIRDSVVSHQQFGEALVRSDFASILDEAARRFSLPPTSPPPCCLDREAHDKRVMDEAAKALNESMQRFFDADRDPWPTSPPASVPIINDWTREPKAITLRFQCDNCGAKWTYTGTQEPATFNDGSKAFDIHCDCGGRLLLLPEGEASR